MKLIKIVKFFTIFILTLNILIILYGFNLFSKQQLIVKDSLGFKEKYYKSYFLNIKSLKSLNVYLKKEAKKRNISNKDIQYLNLASEIVKNRFYYNGYSYYSAEDNIILYALGKYFWRDFDAIVEPNDILKKEHAACSQQSIVLMELLKLNGFNVRKIGLNRHFTLEAQLNKNWYFFDPTFEPNFGKKRKSLKLLLQDKKTLYSSYKHVMSKEKVNWRFGKIKYGKINQFPAQRMHFFHNITFFYAENIILISIFLILVLLIFKRFRV